MLSQLKNRVHLQHKVAIYVPSTVDIDKAADTSKWVENAASGLVNLYGGATVTDGVGYWFSDEKQAMIRESVKIVYAFCDDPAGLDGEKINQVLSFCEQMKKALNQEAISLEIDNELYFI